MFLVSPKPGEIMKSQRLNKYNCDQNVMSNLKFINKVNINSILT